ncbi:hypothetical protein ACSBR2_035702 [Camellia fascicularis]
MKPSSTQKFNPIDRSVTNKAAQASACDCDGFSLSLSHSQPQLSPKHDNPHGISVLPIGFVILGSDLIP